MSESLQSEDTEGDDGFQVSPSEDVDLSSPVDITVEARAHGWRLDHYLRVFAHAGLLRLN